MSLKIIVGCMYSGKSSEIIREYKRLQSIEKNVLLINHKLDVRYTENSICSHDKVSANSLSIDCLQEIPDSFLETYEYIIIDESQFFQDLFEFVTENVDNCQRNIIVVGLNGDSNRSNFGDIYRLYPMADDIVLLKALCSVCKDGTNAIFSKKIIDSSNQTDIGSSDKYIAVCRNCYLRK
jgi:thymidine kinase